MHEDDDVIWQHRFRQYRPLELVDFLLNTSPGRVQKLACEELDRQLVERGFEPRRGIRGAQPGMR